MAQISSDPSPVRSRGAFSQAISYIFDVRFLGVLGQLAFIALMVYGAISISSNFASNAELLGDAQFRCSDGSSSYRCAYDFMDNNAGFDISDAPLDYETTDSFWWALVNGIVNTFRVGLLALIATTILGTLAGIARLSDNWLVSQISLAYVEIIRNTPILIQLLIIYFSVILALPDVTEAIQPFGLSVFLSNRGLSLPWPRLMQSGFIWVGFLIAGLLAFIFLWRRLGRRQLETGKSTNRFAWSLASFVVLAIVGWFAASAVGNNEGLLVPKASNINSYEDIQAYVVARSGISDVSEFETMSEEELTDAALQVCVLRDSPSEPNLTNKLNAQNIPYRVRRNGSAEKAAEAVASGRCELFAAPNELLAEGLEALEAPNDNQLIPIAAAPVVISRPRFEGFNVSGGWSMTGEFFALFLGLTIFYAGGLAEVVRAGILSVSKGQTEAARSLGLMEGQRLSLIVLPQALKVIIPPLISTYLSLMKDTSLGVAIAFPEMYLVSQVLMNQSGRVLQIMIIVMVVYLLISILFSAILNAYNKRVVLVER